MDDSTLRQEDHPEQGAGQTRMAAEQYALRGWSTVPVPHRSKNPGFNGWEQLRVTQETVGQYFNGQPQNIGVLLGEPSGWLIDVDLDHRRAVELAAEFLPSTPAIFGRPGKLRSHWIYRTTGPVATKKIRSKSAGMIVELRSTGQQTVFPPSTHESGEPIAWESEGAEPAEIAPDELLAAVVALGNRVKVELGERAVAKKKQSKSPSPAPEANPNGPAPQQHIPTDEREARCLAAMMRIGIVDQKDGSSRLFAAACRTIEHDLDAAKSLALIREYSRRKSFPKDWSDDEILRRVQDAEARCERGKALVIEADGTIGLGGRDPQTGKLVLSPRRTVPTGEAFRRDFFDHRDGSMLVSYAGTLWHWRNNRYVELEDEAVRRQLQEWLHDSLRYIFNKQTHRLELVPFESNPATVKSALETVKNHVHLPVSTVSPSWLRKSSTDFPPAEIVPCRSQLLHLPTRSVVDPTPAFFSFSALDFDPVPNAPAPLVWFEFLHQLFDGDIESLDLLQEWFGYSLTGDTSQQKMLFIVGPRRSGKGTIARVLRQLVGPGNVCGPTTSSLAGQFGLQTLIGKTLAIVSDARFSGDNIITVVERLLCISGEDAVSVDRKFLGSVTMKLATRFMFLSNELPRLNDSSGALAGRFMILRLTRSFYGHEDTQLTDKLLAELPAILNWAIVGWQRLHHRGHFLMPQSTADALLDLQELSSPVTAFVREECVVASGQRAWVDDLYGAWVSWCGREGRTVVTNKQTFGRDLVAAFSEIHCRRGSSGRFYDGIGLKRGQL